MTTEYGNGNTGKKVLPINIIAGCLFIIMALFSVGNFFGYYTSVLGIIENLLFISASITLAVVMFGKIRKQFAAIGFAVFVAGYLLRFIYSLMSGGIGLIIVSIIRNFVNSSGYIAAAVIVFLIFSKNGEIAEKVKKVWFVPGILSVLSLIMGGQFLYNIIYCAAMFLSMLWFAYPDGMPAHASANVSNSGSDMSLNEGYCSLVKHVLLLLFTFGIWQLIWVYKTTGYLNQVKGEEYRNPTNKLLLYMFVPFYSIYWIYKSAQRIDKLAAEKGLNSELSTLCLILAIFIPFIALILMQDKINAIATANGTSQGAGTSALKNGSQLDAADELKKYKDMLDNGVITQEEFDAKKKQLLGL